MKNKLKAVLFLFFTAVLAVAALGGYILASEYKPAPVEAIPVEYSGDGVLRLGDSLSLISWNIGYGGLGSGSDFFMDGGSSTRAASRTQVQDYLAGIGEYLKAQGPDFLLLQELDMDSSRSFRIDQKSLLSSGSALTAYNYACPFVPYPMPPLGRIYSGLMTDTGLSGTVYVPQRAERVALPCPFSWPVSAANLKRCLLVSYFPIEGSDRQLVLINLHLEAYDSGEGKIAQTNQLWSFMEEEYAKGNYVIAGGDFNQNFPEALAAYPNIHQEIWMPGTLDESELPAGWRYAYDLEAPSCRLLNQPYDPSDTENTQHYVIDGFILSPNVRMESVHTADLGFACSDHNPVTLSVTLEPTN